MLTPTLSDGKGARKMAITFLFQILAAPLYMLSGWAAELREMDQKRTLPQQDQAGLSRSPVRGPGSWEFLRCPT